MAREMPFKGLGKRRRGFVTSLGMEDRCEGEASPSGLWKQHFGDDPIRSVIDQRAST